MSQSKKEDTIASSDTSSSSSADGDSSCDCISSDSSNSPKITPAAATACTIAPSIKTFHDSGKKQQQLKKTLIPETSLSADAKPVKQMASHDSINIESKSSSLNSKMDRESVS